MQKWFYVLELEGGNYYVGISGNLERRLRQHAEGTGAEWTRRHRPVRLALQHPYDVSNDAEAERLEDLMTLQVMAQHGLRKVRGGHFCNTEDAEVESALRAHDHLDWVRQAEAPIQEPVRDWTLAGDDALRVVEAYHDGGWDREQAHIVLTHLLAMKAHRHWRPDLDPGLKEQFWGRKGLLPVLLTFKRNRVLGSGSHDPFAVLAAALQRGRGGNCPWSHLFLGAWEVFKPAATAKNEGQVRQLREKHSADVLDCQYDPIVSILLPQMRWILRGSEAAQCASTHPRPQGL
jgi:predicted GIY-YIG superfamily endonuclease